MKKTLLLFVIAFVPLMSARGGFIGTSDRAIMTVAEVSKLGDEKPVVMRGSIEKHLSKDKYQFVDETGKIVVEIDGDDWRGVNVSEKDTVMLIGETDRNWMGKTSVDVDSISIVK